MKKPNMLFKVSGKKDRTIAVMFPNFWINGLSLLFQTMKDYALKNSINLIVFQGLYRCNDSLHSEIEYTIEPASIISKFLNRDSVDGMIICASAVNRFSDRKFLCELCDSFMPLPVVSIGQLSENIPYVSIDIKEAVKSVVDHLLHIHKRKNIAILRGPLDNHEVNERFNAFLSALDINGITFNPEMALINDIPDRKNAAASVKKFMQKPGNYPDAIFCFHEDQAKGVIDALMEMNIKVPQDISVCGYSNDPSADSFYPGITSIDINFPQAGIAAIEAICDYTDGLNMNNIYTVSHLTVIRQSCGCLSKGTAAIENAFRFRNLPPSSETEPVNINLTAFSEQLKNDIRNAMKFQLTEQAESWCNDLVDKYIQLTAEGHENDFILSFRNLLQQSSRCRCDLTFWIDIINILDKASGQLNRNDSVYCKSILNKIRIILGETIEQLEKTALFLSEERNTVINSLNHAFNTINQMSDLLDILAKDLPKIGIPAFYLSVYENQDDPLTDSRLLLAFSRSGRRQIPDKGISFRTLQVIPEKYLPLGHQKSLVLEPLIYRNSHLGFLLFESMPDDSSFYELFSSRLSAVIWNLNLKENLMEAESQLKQKSDTLAKTSDNLDVKNSVLGILTKKLENSRDLLITSDKMASIGKLTAGIAREMSTPIAAVRSSLDEIQNLLHEYESSIDDEDISDEDHFDIADDLIKSIDISEKSVSRATEFIRSIKAQTRDSKLDDEIIFNLADIIKSVLTFLAYELKAANCHVDLDIDDGNIEIYGAPAKMTQAITNIITHAIDSLADTVNKRISIVCRKKDQNTILLKISNNGYGISEEELKKIFVPLFTDKPYGSGNMLSLSIVNDIIKNSFKGTILIESTDRTGTTFTLTLNSIRESL